MKLIYQESDDKRTAKVYEIKRYDSGDRLVSCLIEIHEGGRIVRRLRRAGVSFSKTAARHELAILRTKD